MLIIGVIASTVVSSLLLLGNESSIGSAAVEQSSSAFSIAQGCSEAALQKLRTIPNYTGSETIVFDTNAQCQILAIGGTGNENRFICAEGQVGDSIRRIEIIVSQVLPDTQIYSWKEVQIFTLCS